MNLKKECSYHAKIGNRFFLIFIVFVFAYFSLTQEAFSQKKALLHGIVRDVDLQEALPGVSINVVGSNRGTVTNSQGEYRMFVTPGEIELNFSYIGTELKTQTLQIASGETRLLDIELQSTIELLSELYVPGSLDGQQKALNQQKSADNLKNIVAAVQIGRFPDQNSAEALQRLSGVNVLRDEGDARFVLVRGLSPQYTNINVNGEQIPAPESGTRFVALDAILANQLAFLEVTKALTPDMDGDAIGGSVNLITQTASSRELQVSSSIGLEYNFNSNEPAPQGNLSIKKRTADDKFGFVLNGSYASSRKKSDRYNFDGWGDEPNGLAEFVPADFQITRNRMGLSGTFDYKINEKNNIYLRTLYSELREVELRREFQFVSEYDDDSDETEYSVVKELKDRPENQGVYSFNLGGSRVGSRVHFNYELAYSKAFQDTPWVRYTVFENDEDVSWGIDASKRTNPRITNFTYNGAAADYLNSDLYAFDSYEESSTKAEDENKVAKVNFIVPLTLGQSAGELKFGSKVRLKDKSYRVRYFYEHEYTGTENLLLSDFQGDYTDNTFLDNDFGSIGFFPNRKFGKYIQNNPGDFDRQAIEEDDALDTYEASEHVYAGYVQGKVQINQLMVLAGLRYEKTFVDYKSGLWDADQETVTSLENDSDYGFLLPMVHFKYSLGQQTNIRAAFTQSYARPNFEELLQESEYNLADNEANLSNPNLKPVKAVNLDLFGEHYLGSVGIISGGVFYKRLNDFIYKQTTEQTFLGTTGVEVTQSINGDKGSLFGFELAYQQNLTFLPGLLGGLGIYGNYTYTSSEVDVVDFAGGEDLTEIELPGQAKHIGNIALSYTKGGFNGRISYNFIGKFISEIDGDDLVLIDSREQIDVSVNQVIAKNFTVFVEVVNLTNAEQMELLNSKATPNTLEMYGSWTRFGVKFAL